MRAIWPLLLMALGLTACDTRTGPPAVAFERVTSDRLEHGRRVADVLGCTGCHGTDLTGEDWGEPGFGVLWSANLTRAVPGYTDAALEQAIRSGVRPEREMWEMPSYLFTQVSASDMAALIAFLRDQPAAGESHPAPVFEEATRREIANGQFRSARVLVTELGESWPPEAGDGHALGQYIVRSTCAECHGLDLRGGQPHPGATVRPDLRIAAAYDPESFARLMRTGVAAGDREIGLMSEVARGRYSHFTDGEIEAVHRYLKAVAEVSP